jgi:hypothetical protein
MKILSYGSINLLSKKISNILLVQNCAFNLLSINKITHELNCEIIFFIKKGIFLRIDNKKMNGDGFLENRFYFLNEEKYNFNTKREEELNALWHKRIGHPSDKILK